MPLGARRGHGGPEDRPYEVRQEARNDALGRDGFRRSGRYGCKVGQGSDEGGIWYSRPKSVEFIQQKIKVLYS